MNRYSSHSNPSATWRRFRPATWLLVMLLLTGSMFSWILPTRAAEAPHILFLSSYHAGFDTLPEQMAGIEEVMSANKWRFDITFMDTKRQDTPEHMEAFKRYFSHNLAALPRYDVIIVGDDNALQFVLDEREGLFAGIPVVFMCINDFDRARLAAADPLITGVVEQASLAENVRLALQLEPDLLRMVGIVDDSLTGLGDRLQFDALAAAFPQLTFELLNSSAMSYQELEQRVASFSRGTSLMYLTMFKDAEGHQMTIGESVSLLVQAARVPVYRPTVGGVGDGLLGGKMVSYKDQGRIAAGMAVRILTGTPLENIPALMESPNRVILDANVLRTFDIPLRRVPADAEVLNRERGFFEVNAGWVLALIVVFLFLSVLLLVMAIDNLKRRHVERALQESEEKYRELSLRDPLTGLHNRSGLQEWVSLHMVPPHLQSPAKRLKERSGDAAQTTGEIPGEPVAAGSRDSQGLEAISGEDTDAVRGAFLYLDLDNFKNINDAYGHNLGDEILILIGKRLRNFENDHVLVSRIGGDEFVLATCHENTIQTVHDLLERIHAFLVEPCVIAEREFYLSASCGIAYYPRHGRDFHELLRNVDAAMYKAKAMGRDRYVFFSHDMQTELQLRLETTQDLRSGLDRNELVLHYQPQYITATGDIAGYETLARWQHPEKGLLYPDSFITAAEEGGLIVRLGEAVLEEACRFSNRLRAAGIKGRILSVNVSAVQLQQGDFVEHILAILRRNGVPRGSIMLELTESAMVDNMAVAADALHALRLEGVPICLDDFGTGYSSLTYLRELPIDVLKLDRSFVMDLDDPTARGNLSEDIIRIAHKLGVPVVGEGVETHRQKELLESMKCDMMQGYLTGRPVSEAEIFALERRLMPE